MLLDLYIQYIEVMAKKLRSGVKSPAPKQVIVSSEDESDSDMGGNMAFDKQKGDDDDDDDEVFNLKGVDSSDDTGGDDSDEVSICV